ncbi:MAG: hypothetical protein K1X64_12435 [Myxococcaceae bacterium]|nr:hypothetical protein [Myxococcaceae bacterium]
MNFFANVITGAIGALLWLIVAAGTFAYFGPPVEGTGEAYANLILNLWWMSAVGALVVATSSFFQGPRGKKGWRLFSVCLVGAAGGLITFALLLGCGLWLADRTQSVGQMVMISFLPALILLPAVGAALTKRLALSQTTP